MLFNGYFLPLYSNKVPVKPMILAAVAFQLQVRLVYDWKGQWIMSSERRQTDLELIIVVLLHHLAAIFGWAPIPSRFMSHG